MDGVIAKHLDKPYAAGERDMLKVKTHHTVDCVVGGFRYSKDTRQVGSLLLGLFDANGKLDRVGFTSAISAAERPAMTKRLEAVVQLETVALGPWLPKPRAVRGATRPPGVKVEA